MVGEKEYTERLKNHRESEFDMNSEERDTEQPFEQSLDRLEKIVAAMEAGNLNLDEMIANFEEGQKLIARCQKRLTEVERRVEALVKGENGAIKTVPFNENVEG